MAIQVEVINDEDMVVENITVQDQDSFDALERLCDGFGYTISAIYNDDDADDDADDDDEG